MRRARDDGRNIMDENWSIAVSKGDTRGHKVRRVGGADTT